ncbi:peptidoglycan DD-metalloendopeptidase family protein (plasmid) [Saccharopolyspora sp. ID03-671]|uniref:peptidoglycan DD-metalloendopeptidase family protein n=1 Tax=Saccharopolyspora sp. ID03-671 TaxID=3073066 RepID=UPI0030F4950D
MSPRSSAVGCGAFGFFALIMTGVLAVMTVGAAHQQQAQATGGIGTVGAGEQLKPGSVPEKYVPLINKAAGTCPEITAPLLGAQIEQESGWNEHAVSPVGAQGLTQFMPATWASSGVDGDGDGQRDPRNPADAIASQARYMCDQVRDIKEANIPGDVVDLALAAYNAGFGAVKEYSGIPPYSETQNYVKKIRKMAAEISMPAPTQPSGGPVAAGGWITPAQGRCSSGFGARWGEMHKGQDIANTIGTPILAASAGRVIASGPASGYGLWVKVAHANGVVTIYGHNNRNLVEVGAQVAAGQPIAEIGNRGESTGPHLHYQVEVNGEPVNPVSWHQQQGAPPLCG